MYIIKKAMPQIINLTKFGKSISGEARPKSLKEFFGIEKYNGRNITEDELFELVKIDEKLDIKKVAEKKDNKKV